MSCVQGHCEAAYCTSLPAQRVSHVCLRGAGSERVSPARAPPGAQLARFHP